MNDGDPGRAAFGPLQALLWAKARIARHWLASVRGESKLKVAFVSLSALGLWLSAFLVSLGFFHLFQRFGAAMLGEENNVNLTDLVLERLLSLFSLTVFVLLVVSNVLVSFATIYRSKEVAYLIQAPIPLPLFFLGRFYECVTFSSWALAFLGSPVLLAYGLKRGASPLFYLALVVFYLPFVAIPAAFGTTLTVLLVRLLAGVRRAGIVAFGLLAALLGVALFRLGSDTLDLERAQSVQALIDLLAETQSPLFPSHWLTQGLLLSSAGNLGGALFYWLLLLANALFFVALATLIAERLFYRGWTDLQSADEGRRPAGTSGPLRHLDRWLAFVPEPARSLVIKDIRLFWRDPAQWSQFLIFFGLMALYVANLRVDGGMFAEQPWRSWIALLNMTASMLILATLTTRFIFPLISLEGRRFWILGLAPLPLRGLLWQKFWLSLCTTSSITLALALLSGWRLRLQPYELGLSVLSVVATTVALSGLAVGLGSLYPNFEEDNPARITSGMGGTLNFILSLAFIVVVTFGQGLLLQWPRLEPSVGLSRAAATLLASLLILGLSLLTCLVPMHLGRRNLERAEP